MKLKKLQLVLVLGLGFSCTAVSAFETANTVALDLNRGGGVFPTDPKKKTERGGGVFPTKPDKKIFRGGGVFPKKPKKKTN